MPRNRALGRAIDAGRWDAEAPLGRIVLVAHAAFLDAGFVPRGGKPAGSHRLPREVGVAASTLSLRYTIPELAPPTNAAVIDAAVLRLCAYGKFLILYVYLTGDGSRPSTRWACINALSVAPVLSGDLDATGHALANDAMAVQLWEDLAGGLCLPFLPDICQKNRRSLLPRPRRFLPPASLRFLSFPTDLQTTILSRLSLADLAMVERTCTVLRDLVAGLEIWRAKYVVERRFLLPCELSQVDNGWDRSWKGMYLRARRSWAWRRRRPEEPKPRRRPPRPLQFRGNELVRLIGVVRYYFAKPRALSAFRRDLSRCKRQDPTELLIRSFCEKRSNVQVGGGDSHRRAMAVHGTGTRRCRDGAINSPSARYRWTHR